MLISADDFEAIASGRVDTAFRRWVRPTVKAGGTLTTEAGVLAIDAVDVIALDAVTPEDLARAGFDARDTLDDMLGDRKGSLYRIRLHYVGEDPRLALRENAELSDADAREIAETLARMDGSNPWVHRTLVLIGERPGDPAQALAETLGLDKVKFKGNVRRLKSLGLTESLDIGYRLSPRGRAWLDWSIASA
ncbi:ASCH domain-containing protein [Devosia sediminis]|uniref:ASCH domain-containing protein n=1 Tax=Devosia sediminis TaxID=2798801 RepID=A0A934IXH9_9HYPH|nr:ASCH domain-containing protein [Devosia sediminis]MBJ3784040.1 ASCH domain-containing protein [Devosia sediminis]